MNKKLLLFGLVFLLMIASAFAVLDDATGAWTLDDGDLSGSNPLDISGNSNTGTNSGATTGATGKVQEAFDLDGTNDYIDLTTNYNYAKTQPASASLWIKSSESSFQPFLGTVTQATNNGWHLDFSSGKLQYTYLTSGSDYIRQLSDNTYNDNAWHHIVVTYDGSSTSGGMTIYVDGVSVSQTASSGGTLGTLNTGQVLRAGNRVGRSEYYDGLMDEIYIYDKELSASEVSDLYDLNVDGYNPYNEPATSSPADTLTVVGKDIGNSSSLTSLNVTWNGTTYTNATGNIVSINITDEGGNINITHNFTVSSATYFDLEIQNWNLSETYNANLTQYPFVTARNEWNNNTINTFNVTINNTLYEVTTGKQYVPYNASFLTQFEFSDYFDRNVTHDFTNQADLNQSIYQTDVRFFGKELLTGNNVSGNVTIDGVEQTEGDSFFLSAGTHEVTYQGAGYFTRVENVTVTALQNGTINISNLGNSLLKLNATNAASGGVETNFNISFRFNGTELDTYTTTNGSIFIPLIQGYTYGIFVNDSLHAQELFNITPTSQYHNETLLLSTINSILLTFYDEVTGEQINGTNMTALLIGANNYAYTTTNGTIFADLITPSGYEIRYYSTTIDDYKLRSSFFTLTNLSFNNIALYSLNESTSVTDYTTAQITFLVLDTNFNPVENARVVVQRYYFAENGFISIFERATNSAGEAVGVFETIDAFYKYNVYVNDVLEFSGSTSGVQFTENDQIIIYVDTFESYGQSISDIEDLSDVSTLTYVNQTNTSGYFELNYENPNNIQICLEVSDSDSIVSFDCQTSSLGTIQASISSIVDETFVAKALGYDVQTGQYVQFDQKIQVFDFTQHLRDSEETRTAAIFISAIVLIGIGIALIKFPVISLLAQLLMYLVLVASPLGFLAGQVETTVAWVVSLIITAVFIIIRGKNE